MEAPISSLAPTWGLTTSLHNPTTELALRLVFLALPFYALYLLTLDYRAFKALGPGGTPSTPLGYLKIKLLSLIALRNVHAPAPIPSHFRPQTGYLKHLPPRTGTRPTIRGIAPQRQMDQKSSLPIYLRLSTAMRELTAHPKNALVEKTSCFEKHSAGLFAVTPITRTCGGEVCHAHPSDGSLHMTLHPADAKVVIENGWGERHPLAKGGWMRRFVPKEFIMIYAPREEAEVALVMEIVCAAAWWVSGVVVGEETGMGLKEERLRDVDVDAEAQAACWGCRRRLCQTAEVDQMVGSA
ncbi:hypothetical protein BU16DRAFT_375546 [Lophium mytilinum]|uniref:Luciferase domain-containing protein n=1 Tax=Lophium mytilinum TaxID=390894 RepID=A0A6A6QV99_9PEZI|nr:hypothetical protein BU16DRAFT_375546 [Lophium mytilinum]